MKLCKQQNILKILIKIFKLVTISHVNATDSHEFYRIDTEISKYSRNKKFNSHSEM